MKAKKGNEEWPVNEIAFMAQKTSTHSFEQTMNIDDTTPSYHQSTIVDIYGRITEHTTDENLLKRA